VAAQPAAGEQFGQHRRKGQFAAQSTFTSPPEMVVPAALAPLTMPPDDTVSTPLLATPHIAGDGARYTGYCRRSNRKVVHNDAPRHIQFAAVKDTRKRQLAARQHIHRTARNLKTRPINVGPLARDNEKAPLEGISERGQVSLGKHMRRA
jgi:hypothetical protein